MAELRQLDGCEHTKARVLHLVETFAGERMYITMRDTVRITRLRAARRLLRSGLSRTQVARQLAQQLEVSESTAYRIIAKAL